MIDKKELRYIIGATIFAFITFLFVIPSFVQNGFESSSPYFQFILFYLGIFIFLQIFLKAVTLGRKINFLGSLGIVLLVLGIDIMTPPFMVSKTGELLSGPVLSASAPDYLFGFIANSIGLTGMWVYLFTYIFVPIILLIIAAKLIPNFVRHV